MRRLTWLALLAGCGAASSPPSPDAVPNDTIVVATPAASTWAPIATVSALPSPVRPPRPATLETCVADTRAAMLGPPSVDSELYLRALGDEQRDERMDARKAYLKLISEFPQSPYLPLAYLAFGELFALEAVADPGKWELARQAYQKVLEYPATKNPVSSYARLRLTETLVRAGSFDQALDRGRMAVMSTADNPPCASEIRRAAIGLTIEAYAASGRPERALAFFRVFLRGEELNQAMSDLGKLYAVGDRRAVCTLLASGVSFLVKQALDASCAP